MIRPWRTLVWMTLSVLCAAAALAFVFESVIYAFESNAGFNTLIVTVLILGIGYNFRQVTVLYKEINWVEDFRQRDGTETPAHTTPLLAPMARLLSRKDSDKFTLSMIAMRSLLDSISNRLAESREISRYLIGLLVFLGLLGTFWGLLATVSSVSGVIDNLSTEGGNSKAMFENFKHGLREPLTGMGIAFSSSLFGLAGSLILGFLDLQTGHAQQRFFNDLEEWLSSVTHLSSGAMPGDGETSVPAFVQALLEQSADSIDQLQRILRAQAGERKTLDSQLLTLTQHIAELNQHLTQNQASPVGDEIRQELRLLTKTIAAAIERKA